MNENLDPVIRESIAPFLLGEESKLWEVTFRHRLVTIAVTVPALNMAMAISNAVSELIRVEACRLNVLSAEIWAEKAEVLE